MAHNNIEIEVKFPLYNKDEILAELAKAAEPLKESRQIDT
jgi:adenylate cyclase class IV